MVFFAQANSFYFFIYIYSLSFFIHLSVLLSTLFSSFLLMPSSFSFLFFFSFSKPLLPSTVESIYLLFVIYLLTPFFLFFVLSFISLFFSFFFFILFSFFFLFSLFFHLFFLSICVPCSLSTDNHLIISFLNFFFNLFFPPESTLSRLPYFMIVWVLVPRPDLKITNPHFPALKKFKRVCTACWWWILVHPSTYIPKRKCCLPLTNLSLSS